MATRFYGKAESAAKHIVDAFQNPATLPEALAPVFIRRRDNVPCRSWSWNNQFIAALHGHADARGYKQWQSVGRHVKKGQRAFHILVPCSKKIEETDEKTGETRERYITYGFKAAAVFGLSQTDGDPLPEPDPELTRWLESLPLRDVAEYWGLSVEAYNGQPGQALGKYRPGHGIALGVENLTVWAHELTHAADDRCIGGLQPGQEPLQEVVAQLGAATLLMAIEQPQDADLGFTWGYVRDYAEKARQEPVVACQRVLKRTCDAVALILDTAEQLQHQTAAVA